MAGNSPHETPYIWMAVCLRLAAEPTNTRPSATRATPTQPGFFQPHSSPRPAFSSTCRLPASTQRAAQPTHRQQPQLARAPAGHRSPTGSRGFCPPVGHPPPLEPLSPRSRVRASSAVPTDALKSCSKPSQPCISAAKTRHPEQIAATDSLHLQDSDAEVVATRYAKGAMGGGPEDSAAPATASLAAAQQQKPKTVSGAEWRPAGRHARGDNTVKTH